MYADAPAYVIWLDLVRDSQNEMKFMWLLERGGRGDRCKKFNNEWEFLAKSFQIVPPPVHVWTHFSNRYIMLVSSESKVERINY